MKPKHRGLKTEREAGLLMRRVEPAFANEKEIPGGQQLTDLGPVF